MSEYLLQTFRTLQPEAVHLSQEKQCLKFNKVSPKTQLNHLTMSKFDSNP